ncbi:hypothetical protein [Motilimonas cestriensis]|uniref:Uncharacterized protein n=1 Tax=Motilimonas cestriensis TaxID=2742685 RepID=A0ABS8W689_9GAMM|nr:hypothetical protein [Motilimonas cestriensis]
MKPKQRNPAHLENEMLLAKTLQVRPCKLGFFIHEKDILLRNIPFSHGRFLMTLLFKC